MRFFKAGPMSKQAVCVALSICFIGLNAPADAKKLLYQLPVSDKMTEGDSPASPTEEKKDTVKLAPIGINGDENVVGEEDENGLLKSTVTQTDFNSKSKAGSGDKNAVAGKTETIVGKSLGDKISKDKKPLAPNLAPLPIQQTDAEADAVADTIMDAEKRQLSDLWQCTIERNPDIQFVIQKLQPTTDANHAMASTMKILSATLFSAMNMAPMMMPGGMANANPAALMGMSSGAGMLQGLFQDRNEKSQKKHAISQEQATILYKIVRDTADKLVSSYREYKKEQSAVSRATADLADLQAMAAEAVAKSPTEAVGLEYTLRKAKRDIDEKLEQSKLYHQQLSDLAGAEAIDKLDKELIAERSAVDSLVGGSGSPQEAPTKIVGPFKNPLGSPGATSTAENERSQDHTY